MDPLTIQHSRGRYSIRPVPMEEALHDLPASTFLITDENVARAWGHLFPKGTPSLALKAGEQSKTIAVYEGALEWLAQSGATRASTIVAVGGGVVGDAAGFLAATYMRGVAYVQVPTSLLAQVDSAIGGKVGLDLPSGKNLVGSFWPPSEVRLPVEALSTLPADEFRSGMAEVWKYGFILDEGLVQRLDEGPMHAHDSRLPGVIQECLELKKMVVEEDEFEKTGRRAALNFGHTIGHALEKAARYEGLKHGEAVSIGMVVEARLGERLSLTPEGTSSQLAAWLEREGLPVKSSLLAGEQEMLDAMAKDKKATECGLSFVLLTRIGDCKLVHGVAASEVVAAMRDA
jgi:3-dehydroquinate synthase